MDRKNINVEVVNIPTDQRFIMKENVMEDSTIANETVRPMRGMELIARSSIHSLRPPSIVSTPSSNNSEAHIWKLTDLRV
jgi:hypothetical protein